MYCGNCGNFITREAKFCPVCGKAVNSDQEQDQKQDQNIENIGQGQNEKVSRPSVLDSNHAYQINCDFPDGDALPKKTMRPFVFFLIIFGSVVVLFLFFSCIMGAIFRPVISAVHESARQVQCQNNLRIIGIAVHNYHDNCSSFPAAYSVDKNGKPLHSWRVTLLPYLGEGELYDKIHLDEPWDSEYNRQFHKLMPICFRCPSQAEPWKLEITHYAGIVGEKGFFQGSKQRNLSEITDGINNTIMIAECQKGGCWMDPKYDLPLETVLQGYHKNGSGLGSLHSFKGFYAALADGSVRYISNSIEPDVLKKMLIIKGVASILRRSFVKLGKSHRNKT